MRVIIIGAIMSLVFCAWVRAEDTIPIETIILEAENQSFEGMVAVGEVIRNRAFKGSRTFKEVCLAPYQFSAWNDRLWASNRLEMVSEESLVIAKRAWEASSTSNKAQGATHYCTLETNPYWSINKRPTVIIGQHKFYNNIK